jgi:orotate phosphoribosyltransferase
MTISNIINTYCVKKGNFTLKSGKESSYYIDLSQLFNKVADLHTIIVQLNNKKNEIQKDFIITKIASIELRGALLASALSYKTFLPLTVIRKENKKYGMNGRIVGTPLSKEDNVLLFDDVISEGQTKLEAIKVIEETGAKVKAILVVVDREMGGKELLEKSGYPVYCLTKISLKDMKK